MRPYPARASFARRFWFGLSAPLAGVRLLWKQPGLWGWSLALAATSVAVFVLVVVHVVPQAGPLLEGVWERPLRGVAARLWLVARLLVGALLVGASYLCAVLVSRVVAAPLYDKLSESVERLVSPRPDEPFSWRQMLRDTAQGLRHTLYNALLSLVALAAIAALAPLAGPGAPLAASALTALWASTVAALEFTDMPMSRRRLRFGAKWGVARRHWATFAGLGLGTYALLAVPVLNIVLVPIAVASGTLVYVAIEAPDARSDGRVGAS